MHYKDELTELVKEALKEGIPALVKEYGDEDITVISIDADNTISTTGRSMANIKSSTKVGF